MMVEIKRLLVLAMAALACVSMWNCGYEGDGERVFADHFGSASIVGFIDDSLVIVADDKSWSQNFSDGTDFVGRGHQRLRVFNYRVQEDGPRWTDTLDNFTDEFDYVKGQVSDSVIWGAHGDELISFWKLGEKPIVQEISVKMEGCSRKFAIKNMRNWVDGLIWASGIVFSGQRTNELLNAGGDTCQYAVLDTVAGILTFKRLDEKLKWIQKCDDVRAWGDDVYCFVSGEHPFEAVLLRNGIDSIDVPIKFTIGEFWGDVLRPNANLCALTDGNVVCSGAIWRGGLTFYENDEIVVNLE